MFAEMSSQSSIKISESSPYVCVRVRLCKSVSACGQFFFFSSLRFSPGITSFTVRPLHFTFICKHLICLHLPTIYSSIYIGINAKQTYPREREGETDVQINRFTSENHLAILIKVKSKTWKYKNQNNNKLKRLITSKEKINGPIYQCV